jgi:hypothetical protein
MTAYWRLGFINASFSVARPVRFGLWKASRRLERETLSFFLVNIRPKGEEMGDVYLRNRPSPITACIYSRINAYPTPSYKIAWGIQVHVWISNPGLTSCQEENIDASYFPLWLHLCKTDRKNGIQLCLCCRSHESEHSASSAVCCSVKLLMPHSYDETATSSAASQLTRYSMQQTDTNSAERNPTLPAKTAHQHHEFRVPPCTAFLRLWRLLLTISADFSLHLRPAIT